MKLKKAFKPSAVPVKVLVRPGRIDAGGLPTIKEMMKPLVQPFGLLKN
jgi:hypothetical protein